MNAKVLIVEDELLVAIDMEAMIEDLGYTSLGIAPDKESALKLSQSQQPDIALVDVNLRDGATGGEIGALLSQAGTTVIFITANPRMLGSGIPGTLGVLPKPCDEDGINGALAYAVRRRRGEVAVAPGALSAFS